MSRTYRKYPVFKFYAEGRYWTDEEWLSLPSDYTKGWGYAWVWEKQRDKKPYCKPNKKWKRLNRRKEKAQVKDAMRNNRQIPTFRKHDEWDWN